MLIFALSVGDEKIKRIAVKTDGKGRWFIDQVFTRGRSDDQADTSEATPRNLDATPRNLVIGKDIADDSLYTTIFRDGGGCHLQVVGELLKCPPVLAT